MKIRYQIIVYLIIIVTGALGIDACCTAFKKIEAEEKQAILNGTYRARPQSTWFFQDWKKIRKLKIKNLRLENERLQETTK